MSTVGFDIFSEKIRVVAFTDEPLVASGLRSIFLNHPQFMLIGTCRNRPEFLEAARQDQPDVILCALDPNEDLDAVAELRRSCPDSRVVLWRYDFSNEVVHQAREIGILGFVSTTSKPEILEECLRVCAGGEEWIERALATRLLRARAVTLSKRQGQLVALLVQGLKNKEVAEVMGISEGTVKAYLTTLFEKVGAKDRFELALFGLKNLKSLRQSPIHPDHTCALAMRRLVA